MIRRLALLACLLPAAAMAQTATGTVDIDGDGTPDTFSVAPSPESDDGPCVDLTITGSGGTTDVPKFICGADPYDGGVELKPTRAGSMQVIATHYGIGRNKWEETLTLVGRGGAILVGGFTWRWHDAIDPNDHGVCDLNLLTGKGTLTTASGTTAVTPSLAAVPVSEWKNDVYPPECNPPSDGDDAAD